MNHAEYLQAIKDGIYPNDPKCPIGSRFENQAGWIQNIIESHPLNAVSIIYSIEGSERSNHYHLFSSHFLYVISGSVEYYERDVGKDGKDIKPIVYKTGDMFYTPPMKVHKTVFLEDTVLLSLGPKCRTPEAHEEDLVREKF